MPADFGALPAAPAGELNVTPRRLIIRGVLRVVGIVGLTLLGYSIVPVEGVAGSTAAAILAGVGILVILVVYSWQLKRVSHSIRPILAAVEAVSLVFGLFVCLFALLYVALSSADPGAFSEELSRASGVYFTVTVLATVGFGDIVPATDSARIFVTIQMVLGLTLVGTAIKALGASAKSAQQAKTSTPADSDSDARSAPAPAADARRHVPGSSAT